MVTDTIFLASFPKTGLPYKADQYPTTSGPRKSNPVNTGIHSRLFRIYASCRSAPDVDTCLVVQISTLHQHLCTGFCALFALVLTTTPRPS